MIRQTAAVLAATLVLAGQAAAETAPAQLSAIKGQVMVSRAGKLQPAGAGALKAGDRVVAMAGGQASLRYADGCVIALTPQGMATIAKVSPCASGAGLVTASGGASAQAAQTPPPGMTVLQWVGIGLTAVVLTVGLVAAADDATISN